ncbi:hypothetical protein D3C87_1831620 [compost metagenome]
MAPDLTCATMPGLPTERYISWIDPELKACSMGPKPLKGTCSRSVRVCRLNHSMIM